jgi:hypothetical protein
MSGGWAGERAGADLVGSHFRGELKHVLPSGQAMMARRPGVADARQSVGVPGSVRLIDAAMNADMTKLLVFSTLLYLRISPKFTRNNRHRRELALQNDASTP